MWQLKVKKRAYKDLRSLPSSVHKKFADVLEISKDGLESPLLLPAFKYLKPGRRFGSFRLGLDHRAGVLIDETEESIEVLTISSRENFYRRFPPT